MHCEITPSVRLLSNHINTNPKVAEGKGGEKVNMSKVLKNYFR